MNLAYWNINWLRAILKKWNLVDFIKQYNPDIMWLWEIKVNENQIDKWFIYFLNSLWYDLYLNSALKSWYSWTAILTKIKPINIYKWINIDKGFLCELCKIYNVNIDEAVDIIINDNEWRILNLEFEKFYFISVYVPNTKEDLSRLNLRQVWDRSLLNYIKNLKKPVILCWDMNVAHQPIDLKYPKANEWKHWYTIEEREWFSLYLENWFIDVFRYFYPEKIQYTRWSMRAWARKTNAGWRIDYFLISKDLISYVKDCIIYDNILWSDHAPIWLFIEF